MSGISTHVLNTAAGRPGSGVPVRLFRGDQQVGNGVTDANGRISRLLPENQKLEDGVYRIVFDVGVIFPEGLYPEVSVAFRVADSSMHYHLPLLISPFGYSTYRGT